MIICICILLHLYFLFVISKVEDKCLCCTKVHSGDHVVPRNWQYLESKFLCKEMFGSISEHIVNFELIVFDVIPDYPCMVDGEGKEYICQFF